MDAGVCQITWGGIWLRDETKELAAKVIRGLRAGESPKEIASRLDVGWECVKAIINRHLSVRQAYIDTHHLRHPTVEAPPMKIIEPLQRIAT